MQETIKIENVDYIYHDCLTVDDYGGAGSVGAANIQDMKKEHNWIQTYMSDIPGNDYTAPVFEDMPAPELISAVGSYGSETLYVRADIWESSEYDCLNDYPCLNDETISEIEMKWEMEGFDSWARSDLFRDLPAREQDKLDAMDNNAHADLVWLAYKLAMEDCNEYPVPEYSGVHIPVDNIQESFNANVIKLFQEETFDTRQNELNV
jgi:hypothetical protein